MAVAERRWILTVDRDYGELMWEFALPLFHDQLGSIIETAYGQRFRAFMPRMIRKAAQMLRSQSCA